jgi:hypothetical protein
MRVISHLAIYELLTPPWPVHAAVGARIDGLHVQERPCSPGPMETGDANATADPLLTEDDARCADDGVSDTSASGAVSRRSGLSRTCQP